MPPIKMSESAEITENQSFRDDELALIDLKAILEWLATPAARHPEDELAPLHAHLTALRETTTAATRYSTCSTPAPMGPCSA
jgi:hypothetical protein